MCMHTLTHRENRMDIGKSIRLALAHKNMTKTALAKGLGCTLASVTQLLRRDCIKSDMIQKLANVFEMKVSEFIKLGED